MTRMINKTELKNNGFTRNGLSLDNYYTKFKIDGAAKHSLNVSLIKLFFAELLSSVITR